jgi:hypothetical protein
MRYVFSATFPCSIDNDARFWGNFDYNGKKWDCKYFSCNPADKGNHLGSLREKEVRKMRKEDYTCGP